MPLAERSTLAVLSGKSDWRSFGNQRTEGHHFGDGPIDWLALIELFFPRLEERDDFGMGAEVRRESNQRIVDAIESLDRRARGHWFVRKVSRQALPPPAKAAHAQLFRRGGFD